MQTPKGLTGSGAAEDIRVAARTAADAEMKFRLVMMKSVPDGIVSMREGRALQQVEIDFDVSDDGDRFTVLLTRFE
jgi:hypothetical protein